MHPYTLGDTHMHTYTDNSKIITDGHKSQSDPRKFIIIKRWLIRLCVCVFANPSLYHHTKRCCWLYYTGYDHDGNDGVRESGRDGEMHSIAMKFFSRPENSLSFFYLPFFSSPISLYLSPSISAFSLTVVYELYAC